MHVKFSQNVMSCQPLRFGDNRHSEKNVVSNHTSSSNATVSKAEYDKLNAKYELACRLAVAQADQYNKYVASCKK